MPKVKDEGKYIVKKQQPKAVPYSKRKKANRGKRETK